jgi:Flp pilus assembly pilin Flp
MSSVARWFARLVRGESGSETLEWGLVCGLIIVGTVIAMELIGPKMTDVWSDVDNAVPAAVPHTP